MKSMTSDMLWIKFASKLDGCSWALFVGEKKFSPYFERDSSWHSITTARYNVRIILLFLGMVKAKPEPFMMQDNAPLIRLFI